MADMLHEIEIDATPEKVYEAIAMESGLRGWWTTDTETQPEVGSLAMFGFGSRSLVLRMRIEELRRDGRVRWTCVGDDPEWRGTELVFDIGPSPHGTRLRFRHGGWQATDGGFATCNTTWGELLNRLKSYVEGRNPGPRFTGTGL